MSEFQLPNLTIKDKINYPYILANALLKFQEAIIKAEGELSEQEVREAALCLFNMIPKTWYDEKFIKDVKKATFKVKVDVRKEWCGVKVGQPKYEKVEEINPYRLVNACVNLLERRELISKKERIEKVEGVYIEPDGEFEEPTEEVST
ncbi:MAG: hypothetical protein QXQ94_07035 [Candidatus Bathyarchaeia archaeon]